MMTCGSANCSSNWSVLSEADKELYFSNYGQHITIKGTIKSVSDEELQEVFNKMYELYDPIFAERDSDMTLEEFHGYLTDPFIPYAIEITSIGTFNWTPFIPAGIIVFLLALVLEICFVFKLKKRIVLPVVCGLFVLIPVIMFFNHIRTMTSVKKVTDGLYTMENYLCTDTKGLLESDAHTVSDLFDWILDRHFYGLKVDINEDNFAFGCAAFAANTPDGDHLFGRNFDYMETDSVLVHSHPKGAYESIGVADLAVLGVGKAFSVDPDSALGKLYMAIAPYVIVDGINEKGVGAGILELDIDETHQDNGNPDLLIFCAIRGILDNCASVDEALAFLRSYDIQTDLNATYHLFITDKSGKYVVVEWLENEMVVTERACATNSVVAPGKHFDEGDPDDRLPTIDQCLGSSRVASETDAMKILAKVKNVRFTEWSCVYNLEKFTGATELVAHDFNSATGEGSVIFKGVVTALGSYVFDNNDVFTSLTIPSSVTTIGSDAFSRCDNLTTVSLPNTVTSLGNYLFWRSTSLTTVNIPTAPELTRLPEIMFDG